MTIACPAPDETLGVVLRLAATLDCQGRALGENGFEALTGGPIVAGLLSGAITVFVALIGYRMILGTVPSLRDGVGWAVRLGFVLALATSWPAFQTLVYRIATDAPEELAATLLPATGLPANDIAARVQDAYAAIGAGTFSVPAEEQQAPPAAGAATPAAAPTPVSMSASPMAASLIVLSSVGVGAALRLTVGILVAIGPLILIGLLFDATLGLVAGWIRTLGGAALAVLATNVVTGCELLLVESELAKARDIQLGLVAANSADPQSFATIAMACAAMTIVAVYASFRAIGGLRLRPAAPAPSPERIAGSARSLLAPGALVANAVAPAVRADPNGGRTRVASVSDALVSATRREAAFAGAGAADMARAAPITTRADIDGPRAVAARGGGGRRTAMRRTRTAARRDRPA